MMLVTETVPDIMSRSLVNKLIFHMRKKVNLICAKFFKNIFLGIAQVTWDFFFLLGDLGALSERSNARSVDHSGTS